MNTKLKNNHKNKITSELFCISKKNIINIILQCKKDIADKNQIEKTITISIRENNSGFDIHFIDKNGNSHKFLLELKKYS